jgi:hypothetical protein
MGEIFFLPPPLHGHSRLGCAITGASVLGGPGSAGANPQPDRNGCATQAHGPDGLLFVLDGPFFPQGRDGRQVGSQPVCADSPPCYRTVSPPLSRARMAKWWLSRPVLGALSKISRTRRFSVVLKLLRSVWPAKDGQVMVEPPRRRSLVRGFGIPMSAHSSPNFHPGHEHRHPRLPYGSGRDLPKHSVQVSSKAGTVS